MLATISIIVPAYNEERLLGQTLGQVQLACPAFTDRGWRTELIVCDNNSTDRTAAIAQTAGAAVVFEPVNQIARARNRGAAAATGDWLLFIDADSHPSRELFADVATAIESGRCLAGGATVRFEDGYPMLNLIGGGLWNLLSRTRRLLAGSFIFCETAAFRKIGGFNQAMFAGEELDLSVRLHQLAREAKTNARTRANTRTETETDTNTDTHGITDRNPGRTIMILHRHPVVTSARKLRLYSARELAWLFVRAAINPKATLSSRTACHLWYDGRR